MLLRRVRQLPEGPGWSYEVKWDGYRMQALKCGGSVRLLSRNGADFTKRFAEVAQAVARLNPRGIQLVVMAVGCARNRFCWPSVCVARALALCSVAISESIVELRVGKRRRFKVPGGSAAAC